MKWSIQQIIGLTNKGIQLDETLDLSNLKKVDPQIRDISPVRVSGNGTISKETVTFFLNIEGKMTLPCSRTLKDVEYPFDLHVRDVFRLIDESAFEADDEDMADVHTVSGNEINLIPYIEEHILLEIPLQVFSDEVNDSDLPTGEGWELITEETKKDRIDPRLADLAKFFDKKDEG